MKGKGATGFFKAGAIDLFLKRSVCNRIFSRNVTVDSGILFVTGTTFFQGRDLL